HGVMNTDNTALSGETIDSGPCAFMDAYDPLTKFSSIDHQGRYAYGRQPQIGLWNVSRLAEALVPLLDSDPEAALERARDAQKAYAEAYDASFMQGMVRKLGLEAVEEGDLELVIDLMQAMQVHGLDWTGTFRRLAEALRGPAPTLLFPSDLAPWIGRWQARLGGSRGAADRMDAVNPVYVPRNHQVEAALSAAVEGDLGPMERLMAVLSAPFTPVAGAEAYAQPAPEGFGPYQTFCGT
ncbi:MAG: YdiU family protein, partial [Alphaproteobacteria bacterium]|nr:YdiU family protein [Alphaproteobacteria bacterium]